MSIEGEVIEGNKEDLSVRGAAILSSVVKLLASSIPDFKEIVESPFFKKTVEEGETGIIIGIAYTQPHDKANPELDSIILRKLLEYLTANNYYEQVELIVVNTEEFSRR